MEHKLDLLNSVGIPYFNFALFLLAFVFLFRKTLATVAKNRRENFLAASKEAAAALESAKSSFSEVKSRFDALDSELSQFKSQSEKAAQVEASKMVEETEKFVRLLEDETKRFANDAIERARTELRNEIIIAAKEQAAKKIETGLDSAAKEKILKAKIADTSSMVVQ